MAEEVLAEMVSTVFQIVANVGDQVKEGDTLVILESMKMEIPVVAEAEGTVASINVKPGDVIQKDDLIAVIS
ncbi:biotin/lipoyl-binding carrier protein [Nocardia sp. NPDC058058]|uniref:biotin/lipoyl-binding carrier protein n=1 Tax=Nocardia sp. NPDC058058 TaxID=3346317 RepID=UPI0036DB5B41